MILIEPVNSPIILTLRFIEVHVYNSDKVYMREFNNGYLNLYPTVSEAVCKHQLNPVGWLYGLISFVNVIHLCILIVILLIIEIDMLKSSTTIMDLFLLSILSHFHVRFEVSVR